MKKLVFLVIILSLCVPGFTQSYHSMGRSAYVHKNYAKAREMFLKDIQANDKNGDSYYFLGEIEKNDRNYDLALTYYLGSLSRSTTRKYLVNAYWNVIILYEEKGDYGNVVKYCRQMWQRTGDGSARRKIEGLTNKLLWTNNDEAIAKYNSGMDALKKGNKEEAMKLFREAVGIDSSFLAPKFELGMYAYNKGDESTALDYLEPIADRIPYYTEVQLIVANLNYGSRNFSSAAGNFTSIIDFGIADKQVITDARLKRGICYYNMGDLEKAEDDIASASGSVKNDPEPLIILSAIYIKKKNLDGALNVLERAESISPDNPIILYQTGSIYYYKNDWKYVSYFDRLHDITLQKKPEEYAKYLKAYKILMNAHFEKKNYYRVVEISDSILRQTSDYDVLLLSGKAAFYLEKYEKTIERLEKISLKYNDELYLALAYARTGRKEKSMAVLKRIITDPAVRREALKDRDLRLYIEEIDKLNAQQSNRNTDSRNNQDSSTKDNNRKDDTSPDNRDTDKQDQGGREITQ